MYDLPSDTPQEVRLALIKKIKSLGLYTRPLISTWTISTQYLCQDILNILLPMITY